MSKVVKPQHLSEAIMDYLENYREDIQDDVKKVTDEITKKARDELKKTSPKSGMARKTKYFKGWATKISERGATKYHKVVWNKTNYQLTHLLEFGHAKRNGGRTKAIPHIRPVEEKYNVEFVDKLEDKIRRDSK